MLVDTRPELQIFINNWQGKPKGQAVEEVASYCAETNRLPDCYCFKIENNQLISPETGHPVKDSVRPYTTIEKLESQAWDYIEEWAITNNQGISIWVSPPTDIYTTSKIIIHEIEELNGKKRLLNRAILLDLDEVTCLKFARSLVQYCSNKPLLASADEVRKNPLILNNFSIHWTYILEELIPDLSLKGVRLGEDKNIKQAIIAKTQQIYDSVSSQNGQVDMKLVISEVKRMGMIGSFSPSCFTQTSPQTAFGYVYNHSLIIESDCKKIKCPGCGWEPKTDEEVQKIKERKTTCCPDCGWKPG